MTNVFLDSTEMEPGTDKSRNYLLDKLENANLKQLVQLPPNVDREEWIAINVWDFYREIQMLWSAMRAVCTSEKCPSMSAGPKYEYRWANDGDKTATKATRCSAPVYVERLLNWAGKLLSDEQLFPSQIGRPFPKDFLPSAKSILKRLFRIYAHVYCHHSSEIVTLDLERHVDTSFKHFVFFVLEFNLVDSRELAALNTKVAEIHSVK